MAGNIGVSVAELKATSENVRTYNSQMATNLRTVQSSVSQLMGTWEGDAAAQAKAAAVSMENLFGEFRKEVESFSLFLDGAAANWEKAESANVENESGNAKMFNI